MQVRAEAGLAFERTLAAGDDEDRTGRRSDSGPPRFDNFNHRGTQLDTVSLF